VAFAVAAATGTPYSVSPSVPAAPVAPTAPEAAVKAPIVEPRPVEELNTIQKLPVAFVQRKQGLDLEQRIAVATSPEAREAVLQEYREYQRGYQDLGGNWFVGASAMLPDLLQGIGGRIAGAGVGVGLAAALNAIPGLAAVPEEGVTVPLFATTGAKIGGTIGGAAPMYLQGKGQIYADLRERGIEDELANRVAAAGAAPYAAIELLNIYLPGSKVFTKSGTAAAKRSVQDAIIEAIQTQLKKVGPRAVANVGGQIIGSGALEASEEFFQELNNQLWGNLAGWIADNPDASKPLKAIVAQSFDAFQQAIGPSLVLGAQRRLSRPRKPCSNSTRRPDTPRNRLRGLPRQIQAWRG
jgi:hypothetical protein